MEEDDSLVFLDSIEAEEHFLRGRTSTPSDRRKSAANCASALKKKNLIPPLHKPSDRRVSLPRASKAPAINMPTVDKKKQASKQAEADDTPRHELTTGERLIQEQLAALTTMIRGVKDEIGRAESRTVERIDAKVDDLANKLGTRMDKAETDLGRLGTELASAKNQLEQLKLAADEKEKALPELVGRLVREKSAMLVPVARPGRRHRPLAGDATAVDAPRQAMHNDGEEKYWVARRTLRVWPVEGEDLSKAVVSFLEKKLSCPQGRVSGDDFVAKRVYSPPDLTAQNQVLITFNSVGLRDEVKSMAKNLSGSDRKTGIQIEPPDHLRSHYQAFQRLAFQLKRKNPALRRNVKFYDPDLCLTMDLKISSSAEWRCVSYEHAKQILGKTRARTESFSIEELESMAEVEPRDLKKRRRETLLDSESDDEMDSTVIDLTQNVDDVKNKHDKNSRCLRFINRNARSLETKD